MIDALDLDKLRKTGRIGYYFRYPLHRNNFHELKTGNQLCGHYTAKPLYGRLTPEGRVDKSAGFNGEVAVLYVPLGSKQYEDVELIIEHSRPENMQLPNGKRNWEKINEIAASAVKKRLGEMGSGLNTYENKSL